MGELGDAFAVIDAMENAFDQHAEPLFELGLELYPRSTLLRVTYASYILAYAPSRSATAMSIISQVRSATNASFDVRFLMISLERQLVQAIQSHSLGETGSALDV